MPFLSLGDEVVVVIRWHKPVGTTVASGEPLVEVETDKATMDVEAPFEGTLSAQFCEAGDTISPGSIIGYLTRPDEATDEGTTPESAIGQRSPTPSALDVDLPASALAGPPPPLVEHGELRGLPATELGEDATRESSTIPSVPAAPDGHRDVPLTRRRRAIGRRLSEAAQIPQFAVTRAVSLGAAHAAVTSSRSSGINATVTDALVHAVSAALGESPNINAWFLGEHLRTFDHVSIALAVETDDGVVAPVIHKAELLDFAEITRQRAHLVERARLGSLRVDELEGATLTLTNVGPVGGDQLIPVLTPPQVGVIGVGRETTTGAALTFVGDHRALDGADGARFLMRVEEALAALAQSLGGGTNA